MEKIATAMMDAASEYLDKNPNTVKTMLAVGGLGALGGAMFTPAAKTELGETPGQNRWKRLRNAALGAGLGAAGTALISKGWGNVNNAVPVTKTDPIDVTVNEWTGGGTGLLAGLGIGGFARHRATARNAAELAESMGIKSKMSDPKIALRSTIRNMGNAQPENSLKGVNSVLKSFNIDPVPKGSDAADAIAKLSEGQRHEFARRLTRSGINTYPLKGSEVFKSLDLQGTLDPTRGLGKLISSSGSPGRLDKINKFLQTGLRSRMLSRHKFLAGATGLATGLGALGGSVANDLLSGDL